MDQHPYFGLIAACLAVVTLAVIICTGTATWLLIEKARTAAIDRRAAQANETRANHYWEQAAGTLATPADRGPLFPDTAQNPGGKWN